MSTKTRPMASEASVNWQEGVAPKSESDFNVTDVLPESTGNVASSDRPADCASRNGGLKKWYVGIVNNNTERVSAERLSKAGFNVFLPTQTYISIWKDGRRKKRERMVLPHLLFICCTEEERIDVLKRSFVRFFMTNKSGTADKYGHHPIVVIPNKQISQFKLMLDQEDEDVSFEQYHIQEGIKVEVIRGSLRGLEGLVTEISSDKTRVYLNVDILGSASVMIDSNSLSVIK